MSTLNDNVKSPTNEENANRTVIWVQRLVVGCTIPTCFIVGLFVGNHILAGVDISYRIAFILMLILLIEDYVLELWGTKVVDRANQRVGQQNLK